MNRILGIVFGFLVLLTLLGNALDAYLSGVSNRLNEVMKRLTLLTTIFMPISFLVGFGGMNFQQLPFDNPVAFGILIALIFIVPISMLELRSHDPSLIRGRWVGEASASPSKGRLK